MIVRKNILSTVCSQVSLSASHFLQTENRYGSEWLRSVHLAIPGHIRQGFGGPLNCRPDQCQVKGYDTRAFLQGWQDNLFRDPHIYSLWLRESVR